MSVPNFITVSRLFLMPIFIYLMLSKNYNFAMFVFLFAGFTDVLDGYIARKFNKVTDLGKILDPIADKLMQLSALLMIVVTNVVPNVFPLLLIVFAKEIFMIIGGTLLWEKGVVVQAVWYGKASTVLFYTAVAASILFRNFGQAFLIFAVITQIIAFIMYFKNYIEINKSF